MKKNTNKSSNKSLFLKLATAVEKSSKIEKKNQKGQVSFSVKGKVFGSIEVQLYEGISKINFSGEEIGTIREVETGELLQLIHSKINALEISAKEKFLALRF